MNKYIKKSGICLAIMGALAGCGGSDDNSNTPTPGPNPDPGVISPSDISAANPLEVPMGEAAQVEYESTSGIETLNLTVETDQPYEIISIYVVESGSLATQKASNKTILVDNLDIPESGVNELEMLVDFSQFDNATLEVTARNGAVKLTNMEFKALEKELVFPKFADISEQIGLPTEMTLKYGGPSVGDVDGDGDYDFVLNNHNYIAPQMMTNNGLGAAAVETKLYQGARDFHGTALGDYDNDGDLDVVVAFGGANGTNPSSYELLRNDGDNNFTFIEPADSGIKEPSRGRSPRFIDFNQDGLLDLVFINAKTTLPDYDYPQHHFYKNTGPENNFQFEWTEMPGIATTPSERVIVFDYDNDNIDDILLLSPPSLWRGTGTGFEDKSDLLPDDVRAFWDVQAAANIDVNQDGRQDIYIARGFPEYQLSDKAADFDANAKTLDVRDSGEPDNGNPSRLIEFTSDGDFTMSHLNTTFRQYHDGFPLYIGANAEKTWMYATGFQPNQEHPEMKDAPKERTFNKAEAAGFPAAEDRTENGFYIGYVDGKWKMEWVRNEPIYWNISFSLTNVENMDFIDWQPLNRSDRDDYLLVYENVDGKEAFVDRAREWHLPLGGNHWGVTRGDFNNDGLDDLFIHRFGQLRERIADIMLLNDGTRFYATTAHGAHDLNDGGHGDMGQAFDFDGDGKVDLLNGSSEDGKWYLYRNVTEGVGNHLKFNIGYSPKENIDPLSAMVKIEKLDGTVLNQTVGSAGEVFSQGVMNLLNIGLGEDTSLKSITVTWRNGETLTLDNPTMGTYHTTDDRDDFTQPLPTAIDIGVNAKTLRVNETYQLQPTFTPPNAVADVEYTSSAPTDVSVTESGLVTGLVDLKAATITVTSKQASAVTDSVDISVNDIPNYVTDIAIDTPADTSLYIGDAHALQLTADLTLNDSEASPNDDTITWTASNGNATVVDGLVTGKAEGSVTITATANGSDPMGAVIQDTIDLTIEKIVPASVTLDDKTKYSHSANPLDQDMDVTFTFHAGSEKVAAGGVRVYLRRMSSGWGLLQDYAGGAGQQYDVVAGTVDVESGTVTHSLPLQDYVADGLKPTSELENGEFYYLFVRMNDADGVVTKAEVQGVCITAAGDTNPCK